MNTALLSMIPAAPAPEQQLPARPAKSGKPVIEAQESMENAPVEEPVGDSDKADAFAEMLAAMISVATPTVETHVETVQPAAVESVTSTATDIPRDGAGSPLFGASFMTSTPVAPGAAATTTSNSDSILPAGKIGGGADQAQNTFAKAEAGIELGDAAIAELSALESEAVEVTPETASSTFEVPTGDETTTAEVADDTGDNELPIVEARESTVDSGSAQQNTVEIPEPVVAVDHSVKTSAANTQSRTTDVTAESAKKPEAVAPKAEASAKQPVATANDPPASEAPKAESQPVTTPDAATQDFTAVDEPYEDPVDPPAELENNTSVKSTAPRKTPTIAPRPATGSAPISAEPEVVNAVAPVESSAEVGVRKDVIRERAAAPAADAEKSAVIAMDAEAILPTGNTSETTAAHATSNVANTHTDSGAASTPAHVSQQVLQALAAYEAELPQNGSRSFEMLLDPPELGRLLVQMSRTSKGVDVRISAENETVRSILETNGAEMQQSLQLSGFDLGQFTGSSSGGFANGDEWIGAPTLQSFAAGGSVQTRSNTTHTAGTSAVNVIV